MNCFESDCFKDFKRAVESHNIKSGEIILEIFEHYTNRYDFEILIPKFLKVINVRTERSSFKIRKLQRNEALESIRYGLTTKPNYTCIDKEFSNSEINEYVLGFINMFNNPDLYGVGTRLYRSELDLNDFWEVGGAISVDDEKIGIFWINDLYNQFDYKTWS